SADSSENREPRLCERSAGIALAKRTSPHHQGGVGSQSRQDVTLITASHMARRAPLRIVAAFFSNSTNLWRQFGNVLHAIAHGGGRSPLITRLRRLRGRCAIELGKRAANRRQSLRGQLVADFHPFVADDFDDLQHAARSFARLKEECRWQFASA